MILTIGMIVKNEEKYLRSCLKAISPILQQIDSELIIADTGSADSTVEIAKSFTDNVFHFEWCDDFSAARNSTLERARGEWYMAIDADEVFENVSEIIEFFRSGEYKKYNSATYIIRSFNSESRSEYADYNAFRLARITKDLRYSHPIHESLPLHTPTRQFSAVANHYGYLSESNEEFMKQKIQRNLDLLFKELKRQPQNHRNYLEIGRTYCLIKAFDSALEYHRKGLEYARKQKSPDPVLVNSFYAEIAHINYAQNQYSDVVTVTGEYFCNRKDPCELDLQMVFLQAMSLFQLGKEKDSIAPSKDYIVQYNKYVQDGFRTKNSIFYELKFADRDNFRILCMNLVLAYIKEQDYGSAAQVLAQIPVSEWKDGDQNFDRRLSLELNLMAESKNYSALPEMFKQTSGNGMIRLQAILEIQIEKEDLRDRILSEIAESDLKQSEYIHLLRLRHDFYQNQLTKQSVERFIDEIKDWTPLYADAIYFAFYCELDVLLLASAINAYSLNQLLFSSKYLHFKNMPLLICEKRKTLEEYTDISIKFWLSFLFLWSLGSGQLSKEETIRMFQAYSASVGEFLAAAYKEDFLINENAALLPLQLRVGYFCSQAANALKKGDKSNYIKFLKMVLQLYPEFKNVIEILLDDLKKSMADAESSRAIADKPAHTSEAGSLSEFERYALIVKQNIKKLISAGQYEQAAGLLSSYEELCPGDQEIGKLKKEINKK